MPASHTTYRYLPRFLSEGPRDLQDHDPQPLRIGNLANGTPHGRHVQRLRGSLWQCLQLAGNPHAVVVRSSLDGVESVLIIVVRFPPDPF